MKTVAIVMMLVSAPLGAGVIDSSNVPAGVSFVDLGFATITSAPRTIGYSTVNGVTAFGVNGGRVAQEIDLGTPPDGPESITVAYPSPRTITDLRIAFLFQPGQWTDTVFEAARVTADGVDFILTVTGTTTAIWSGPGTVMNLSPALDVNAGVFRIINPFPGFVNTLRFTAVNQGNAVNETNSDFGILRLVDIPKPGSLLLAGGALLWMVVRRRW